MQKIRLTRTGQPALTFTGHRLETAGGLAGDDVRGYMVTLYETKGGTWIVHVEYLTAWRGESPGSDAWQTTPETIGPELAGYDPLQYLRGFPDHEKYKERQANLKKYLQDCWRNVAGELLSLLPAADEEIE